MLGMNGKNNSDGSFNWKDALIDAFLIAALTFFTSLGGMGIANGVSSRDFMAAGIAAAIQFFSILAIKRGLREKQTQTTYQ
jgi:hypothetical protein